MNKALSNNSYLQQNTAADTFATPISKQYNWWEHLEVHSQIVESSLICFIFPNFMLRILTHLH